MAATPIVIVGSGLAGYLFAKELRKLDRDLPLTIITADDGAFCSKPLLSTALANHKTAADLAVFTAKEMAKQLDAHIHNHTRVTSLDTKKQVVITTEGQIKYSKLVLACGSHAVRLPLQGDALEDVPSVNDLTAYAHYREWLKNKKQLTILGSGLVGCEFTNDLVVSGHQIELVSMDAYPLARFVPQSIGNALLQAFTAKGVKWHSQKRAMSVDEQGDQYQLTMDDNSHIVSDGVFSAVGIRATLELAQQAQLKINRAIVVDRYLQTSVEHIYALGDCAEVAGELRQYVAPLLQCARALAHNFVKEPKPVQYPAMPVVVKTSLCPINFYLPLADVTGAWRYEGEGGDQQALFYDNQEQLRGFALTGECVKQRLDYVKQLPPVFKE